MRYFIVKALPECSIFKVKTEDVEVFKKEYAAVILAEADSLMMLLLSFEQNVLCAPQKCDDAN